MSKSLKGIQGVIKFLKVINMIAFVFCIIGTIVFGSVALLVKFFPFSDYEIEGINMEVYLEGSLGMTLDAAFALMIIATISTIGAAITTKLEHSYYKREVKDGTPFTFDGAAHLKKTALICLLISVAIAVITFVTSEILISKGYMTEDLQVSSFGSIGWYLILWFMSAVFNYGAEQSLITR